MNTHIYIYIDIYIYILNLFVVNQINVDLQGVRFLPFPSTFSPFLSFTFLPLPILFFPFLSFLSFPSILLLYVYIYIYIYILNLFVVNQTTAVLQGPASVPFLSSHLLSCPVLSYPVLPSILPLCTFFLS